MDSNVIFAFGLTLLAGLSTGIGSVVAFFSKNQSPRFLSALLGFSAGVMIYVSMIEIFPQALVAISAGMGQVGGQWVTTLSFFGGIGIIALIDQLVPDEVNPHEAPKFRLPSLPWLGKSHQQKQQDQVAELQDQGSQEARQDPEQQRLMRMGVVTALAIAIHNFPEGFATFLSGLQDIKVAIPIAVAIALHNIPEGIAVSAPIYYATGSRRKALWWSFASGLAEPLGAIIGYLILRPFLSDTLFGVALASIAGIMVFISLDELLPTAEEYGEHHLAIGGLVAGMAVMALSLLLML